MTFRINMVIMKPLPPINNATFLALAQLGVVAGMLLDALSVRQT